MPQQPVGLELRLLPGQFAVCRLGATERIPGWVPDGGALVFVARTPDELSIVCDDDAVPDGVRVERGFRAFVVSGPLPFDGVGVMAAISSPLAAAGISLLAISTFDTDYVLVREGQAEDAAGALRTAGCRVLT